MKTFVLLIAAAAALPHGAIAQQQDAAGWRPAVTEGRTDADPPAKGWRPHPLDGPAAPLTRKERLGVHYGRQWAENRNGPARGDDGGIVFAFGATLPTIVCAPLHVCDLRLEPGEVVNDINIGDAVRWQITPATQGSGSSTTTHVIIKPTDVGLITNLIITTDRRAYTIKLVSHQKDWMPSVSFAYPANVQQAWQSYRSQQGEIREAALAAEPVESAANLDFAYEISGDSPSWRPVRVYSNGAKTYIQFPRQVAHGELPALVALGQDGGLFTEPSRQLVNYRYVHGRFEIDQVIERAALISGVGWDQVMVKITKVAGR